MCRGFTVMDVSNLNSNFNDINHLYTNGKRLIAKIVCEPISLGIYTINIMANKVIYFTISNTVG